VDWKKLTGARARSEVAGLGQFGMALFLKELAVVAGTGDRARIEEFFDGLMTTDFYKQYGLFVVGARVGEVAYSRYLERFVKPRFVNSIVKTNLILAAGLALPQIVEGTFTGKAFAISLGSLGLSSAAVKSGVAGIKWVVNLKKASPATLSRLGLRAARVGGWFYTAAELAVVLYLAEDLEHRVNKYLDDKAARNALADAGEAFYSAAGKAEDEDALSEAAETYHDAWIDYRDHLYAPLSQDEAIFAGRMEKAARAAKIVEDRRDAAKAKLEQFPSLKRNAIRRHGSVDAYADAMVAGANADLDDDVAMYAKSYNLAREEHLKEVYEGKRREGGLFDDVNRLDWLSAGANDDAADAPHSGRTDFYGRLGRNRVRGGFRDALYDVSSNRLQTYDDEVEAIKLATAALRNRGRDDLSSVMEAMSARVLRTQSMDDALVHGKPGLITTPGDHAGASKTVDAIGD
jgi:hypothetical protein